jgi:arsenite-transporting ATPase
MTLFEHPTQTIFLTGKGGVGKTSTACALAVRLADRGRSVLLVSTDPASNLDEVFGQALQATPTAIAGVSGLKALNVDPERAAADYRERIIGPYRGVLPGAAIASMEEQLSGACTVEIAAFDEFAKLIGDPARSAGYDHVIFDTAPTGHTLRLLSLPSAWTGFIANSTAGTSCLGPLQGLVDQKALYEATVGALSDPARTTLILVSRPETAALAEAARTGDELAALGLRNQRLVLNGVFQARDRNDPVALALEQRGRDALARMPASLSALPRTEIALRARQLIGVAALREFFDGADSVSAPMIAEGALLDAMPPGLDSLIDGLSNVGHGLIMTMGKGGVGKTTIAARVATAFAGRGHDVLLTTTDPAAHVRDAVDTASPRLEVDRIDARAEVERYRSEVLATMGANLDASGRALLEEDLASPCTEEIAVFQAFARTVHAARDRIVVLDTAPTGHTILLLDAAQAFHREVSRQAKAVPEAVMALLPRLRDRDFTRILICALAEATPVHEAADLQKDLRRAGIEPYAWVINQSLAPLSLSDPILAARRAQEMRYIREVIDQHAARCTLVPWQTRSARAGVREEAFAAD